MTVQAGLAALLTRHGCGTDIPLGTPVAGRDDDATAGLVGFFTNTVVLRTDTSGDPAFGDLLDRVRATTLAAYEHDALPFDHLVEALNPPRSLSRHPLFQVMLAWQSIADGPVPPRPGDRRAADRRAVGHREVRPDPQRGRAARRRDRRLPGVPHRPLRPVDRPGPGRPARPAAHGGGRTPRDARRPAPGPRRRRGPPRPGRGERRPRGPPGAAHPGRGVRGRRAPNTRSGRR